MYEIQHYVSRSGHDLFLTWRGRLRDVRAGVAVDRRIIRLISGNFGDHKFCEGGVWELRIDVGQGYRVYYAIDGHRLVLLLCGGDKSSQSSDIEHAVEYWQDWKERSNERP